MVGPEFRIHPESRERIFPNRLVVKFGTANLCAEENGEMRLNQGVFDDYARQIVELQQQGVQVIVVSSGAIQAGREEISKKGIDASRLGKKDLAGIGQDRLMDRWRSAMEKAGARGVSQLLVTYTNWSNRNEQANIRNTIFNWLNAGDNS